MDSSTTPLFAGRCLTCIRGGRRVFRELDFALDEGQALILTGPNGSGKSSLLRLMAGLAAANAGTIDWRGSDILKDRLTHAARLHYIGHRTGVKAALTAREDLEFWSSLRGRRPAFDCEQALHRFGLTDLGGVPVRLLSAGQQRRLALARLLAAPLDLWLLDEPAVGLDENGTAVLQEAVAGFCSRGGIAVIASHIPVDLAAGAGRLDLADFADDRGQAW